MQILTVILRNDGPMIFCGDTPSHRSVQIELTPEQCEAIKPRIVGKNSGREIYEEISMVFIEPKDKAQRGVEMAHKPQASYEPPLKCNFCKDAPGGCIYCNTDASYDPLENKPSMSEMDRGLWIAEQVKQAYTPEPDGIPLATCAHGKGCHNCIDVTDFYDAQPPEPDGTWMPPTVRKWLGREK